MAAGSVTLGGNVSIALGPLGRNGEAIGSVNTSGKLAAMYVYPQINLNIFSNLDIGIVIPRRGASSEVSPSKAQLSLKGKMQTF